MGGVETYPRFAAAVGDPGAPVDLTRAALAIGEIEYPGLDPGPYLDALARLADEASSAVSAARTDLDRVLRLSEHLFETAGFRGNRAHYYDPRNSYLNEVLDRRTGIPITLALVYIDVGTRLGLDIRGVGFPGHFLVKQLGEDEIIVDPFSGEVLGAADCEERYRAAVGPDAELDPRALDATPPRRILARVLGNLKQIHLAQHEFERSLQAIDRLLLIDPDDPDELRDRGLVHARLECFRAAVEDLERFVELAPRHPSAAPVQRQLDALRQRARMLN